MLLQSHLHSTLRTASVQGYSLGAVRVYNLQPIEPMHYKLVLC
jgi:hypothetical protein